jgi:hypothetical protein
MITIAVLIWSAKVGVKVEGAIVVIIADLIIASLVCNAAVQIWGGG